jgi:amino acid synthesis protein
MVTIRKRLTVTAESLTDGGRAAKRAEREVAAVAGLENPFARRFVDDLTPLIDVTGSPLTSSR